MTDKTTPKSKGADLSGLDDFNLSSFLEGGKKGKAQEDAGNAAPAGAVSYAPWTTSTKTRTTPVRSSMLSASRSWPSR